MRQPWRVISMRAVGQACRASCPDVAVGAPAVVPVQSGEDHRHGVPASMNTTTSTHASSSTSDPGRPQNYRAGW